METVPLDPAVRDSLLRILFGTANPDELPLSWVGQSFSFHDGRSVAYFALVQLAGGPCGVLASIQAWVLQALLALANFLYTNNQADDLKQLRQTALSSALARILWRAAECSNPDFVHSAAAPAPPTGPCPVEKNAMAMKAVPVKSEAVAEAGKTSAAKVQEPVKAKSVDPKIDHAPTKGVFPGNPFSFPRPPATDAVKGAPPPKRAASSTVTARLILVTGAPASIREYLNSWRVVEAHSYEELFQIIHRHCQHVATFGVVPFTCSVLLTKTFQAMRAETEEIVLTGPLKDCSQELVNLFLTGRAVGHLFDGDTDRDGLTLRGIRSPCEIGFLTEEETRGNVEVGKNYKQPLQPIWVLHGGMHYSVLVELRGEDSTKTRHRFYWLPGGPKCRYYELEIDTDPELRLAEVDITDVAILVDCLRTRWRKAKVLSIQELAQRDSVDESYSGNSEDNINEDEG